MELTIKEACTQPQNFMYVWADENAFLRYLKPQWAAKIRAKKANQMKLLSLSAEKFLGSTDRVKEYYEAIRDAFKDTYAMTPAEALVILAQGGTVAGKNWEEGVFGIGAVQTFYGTNISVRPQDGYFEQNGNLLPGDEDKNVYATVGGKAVVYQRFYEDPTTGITYMSQLNKTTKKYYAASYSDANGSYKAKNGNTINPSDNADLWGAILSSIDKFVQWIISIFAGKVDTLSADNTLPNQVGDGFAQTGGDNLLEGSTGLILAAAAAGMLIFGTKGKKSK